MTVHNRRAFIGSAAALGLSGCATAGAGPNSSLPAYGAVPPLAPFRLRTDRIFDITVCLRPFRAAGPRLDAETVGDKLVVHNYGHGGSGWSLSWGSAAVVVPKALSTGQREIAVIGCGALGLTAAITAQRAGASVTIYAKDRMPEVRSARATGTWSPDSRVALAGQAAPGFGELWEQMTRASFKTYRGYLGLPGDPVVWNDRYNLADEADRARPRVEESIHFARYEDRVRDLTPRSERLPPGSHPFPVPYVTRNTSMMFNIMEYGHLLMSDFLLAGGRIVTLELRSAADLAALNEKVVINCTGYGARALWKDESIVPVRGQIAWLIPQPETNYGINYKNVTVLPRKDGICIQDTGPDESIGYNDDNETPDRAAAEAAVLKVAALYGRPKG